MENPFLSLTQLHPFVCPGSLHTLSAPELRAAAPARDETRSPSRAERTLTPTCPSGEARRGEAAASWRRGRLSRVWRGEETLAQRREGCGKKELLFRYRDLQLQSLACSGKISSWVGLDGEVKEGRHKAGS